MNTYSCKMILALVSLSLVIFNVDGLYVNNNEYPPDQNAWDEGTAICIENRVVCPEEDGDFPLYVAISNPSKFCECSNGRPYLFSCPDGQVFDKDENTCVAYE